MADNVEGKDALENELSACFGTSVGGETTLDQVLNRDYRYGLCLNNSGLVTYEVVGPIFDPQLVATSVCPGDPSIPSAECCQTVRRAESCELSSNTTIDTRCKKLLDEVLFQTYECSPPINEFVGLAIVLGVLLFVCLVGVTVLRSTGFGALLRKNFILWRQSAISSILAQAFEVSLIGILVFILLYFTEMNREFFAVPLLGIDVLIETPDNNRLLIYQNLRPFGGLFMLIVLTYPIASMTVSLVSEKETRMKEAMRMAGLNDITLIVTWMVTFIWTYMPMILGIAFLTHNGAVFPNQSVAEIAFFMMSFVFAMCGLSYLVSVFFTSTRPAAIAAICISYLLFFSSFHFLTLTDKQEQLKGCLIAPVCLALGVNTMLDDASLGTGFARAAAISATKRLDLLIQVPTCSRWLVMDGFIYLIGAWYLDKVLPQRFGVRRRPDFVFQPSYPYILKAFVFIQTFILSKVADPMKVGAASDGNPESSNQNDDDNEEEEDDDDDDDDQDIEGTVTSEAEEFKRLNQVQIRNLNKVFRIDGLTGGKRYAVNDLNMSFEKNQITILLGPNGAGKSTTISMLTGIIEPTSGDVSVFGNSIRTQMHKIRGRMGWCPQHDCLYPTLTVYQHLELFSALRNRKLNMGEMTEMLKEMDILDKLHVKSKALSGGQKRKLSVAMALIGDTDIVYLDEPSSGVDPTSRRHLWTVLRNNRKGRAIVMTTHFMDEADVLSDKVIIIANGTLCCEGTSLQLKREYGNGYTLAIGTKNVGDVLDRGAITNLVKSEIPGAVKVESKVAELEFQLPFDQTLKFPKVLRKIQHEHKATINVNITSLEQVFLKVAEKYTDASTSLLALEESAPYVETRPRRSRAFEALIWKRIHYAKRDWRGCTLVLLLPIIFTCALLLVPNVRLYGIIFPGEGVNPPIRPVCESNIPSNSKYAWKTTNSNPVNYPLIAGLPINFASRTCCPQPGPGADLKDVAYFELCIDTLPQCVDVANVALKVRNCYASTYSYCYAAPWLCDVNECCDPTNHKSPFYLCQPFVSLDETVLFDPNMEEVNLNNFCGIREIAVAQAYVNGFVRSLLILLGFIFPSATIIAFAVMESEAHRETKFQQLVNGVRKFTFWISAFVFDQFTYLLPVAVFPLIVISAPTSSINFVNGAVGQATFLVLAFAFNSVAFAYALSFSYSQHARALVGIVVIQIVTGGALSTLSYVLEVVPISIGSITTQDIIRDYVRFILSAFPGYAFADGLLRLQTQMINACGTANSNRNLLFCTDLFTVDEVKNHDNIFDFQVQSRFNQVVGSNGEETIQGRFTLKSTDTLISIAYLVGSAIVFWLYVIIRDTEFSRTWLGCSCLRVDSVARRHARDVRRNRGEDGVAVPMAERVALTANLGGNSPVAEAVPSANFLEVEERYNKFMERQESFTQNMIERGAQDVRMEEERVKSQTTDAVQFLGLRKQYPRKIALDNLWLGIKEGECFGYLGVNGAGKSTTIKMLTGATHPSRGTATVLGDSIVTRLSSARRHVGYCPQFDALYDLLTVREHLTMYAKIRGLSNIKRAVQSSITRMQLSKFVNVQSKDLSGGNKRKLSSAIAMLGSPPVVILDEPTSGCDPHAQRFLWAVVEDTVERTQSAVMLVSHSLPEVEALCKRVGLLIGGKLRCLGSANYLKSLYGSGYEVEIHLKKNTSVLQKPVDLLEDAEFVNQENLILICEALGIPERADDLSPVGASASSNVAFQLNTPTIGRCSWKDFSDWWTQEDMVTRVTTLFEETWGAPDVLLQDRQGSYCLYNISNKNANVADMFELLDHQKDEFDIQFYSISQTSLEEIFQKWVENVNEYENGTQQHYW